jgi:hypothetical protein
MIRGTVSTHLIPVIGRAPDEVPARRTNPMDCFEVCCAISDFVIVLTVYRLRSEMQLCYASMGKLGALFARDPRLTDARHRYEKYAHEVHYTQRPNRDKGIPACGDIDSFHYSIAIQTAMTAMHATWKVFPPHSLLHSPESVCRTCPGCRYGQQHHNGTMLSSQVLSKRPGQDLSMESKTMTDSLSAYIAKCHA